MLADALRELGPVQWLCANYAFDIPLDTDSQAARAFACEAARSVTADINIVESRSRRKRLLAADMESTIIDCECVDALAELAGVGPQVAAITERVMRGEIAFAGALRERVALLRGLPLAALERVYRERVRLNPGAAVLVATMRAHGAATLLLSGGFTFFSERVARAAGFDSQQANVLLDDGAQLTGFVKEPIFGRDAKLVALEFEAGKRGVMLHDTIAVGDGANDLDMVTRAGLGVAWHAKAVLARAAPSVIAHADLTALLYLQGYHEDEIVPDHPGSPRGNAM
jgi:phosphoserine phosphatase